MISIAWDRQFNIQISCQLQLPIETRDKIEILSEFSKAYNAYEKFSKWYSSKDLSDKDREPFKMHDINAKTGLTFLRAFMLSCSITDMEILQYTQIPF
jgi:hypothetical protein